MGKIKHQPPSMVTMVTIFKCVLDSEDLIQIYWEESCFLLMDILSSSSAVVHTRVNTCPTTPSFSNVLCTPSAGR